MPPIRVRATRDVPLTTQTTGVQADISGVSPEFAATANLGQAIQQGASAIGQIAAAEKRRTQEDELHAALISDADSYSTFINERSKNPDYKGDEEAYKKWEQGNRDATLEAFTDPDARAEFSKQLDLQNINRRTDIREFQRGRHKQDIIGNMDDQLEGFARNGLEDAGKAYITGLRENGWISGAQENQFQAQLDASIKNHELLVAEQVVNEEVLQIAIEADAEKEGSGWAATQKWLNDPNTVKELQTELGMSLEDANKVLADVKTRATLANADKVEQEKLASSAEEESVYAKMGKNEFVGINEFIQSLENTTSKRKIELQDEALARSKKVNLNEPDRNDPEALDKVNTAISQVGNNTLDLDTAKDILRANSHLLKSSTVDSSWKQLNGEFDASIDSATANVRTNVRLRAIGKSETALDRLLEAVAGVSGAEEKGLQDRITTARVKFNLELDQFNRWEEAQKTWRQNNREASPDEIEREGMRSWYTDFNVKDTEELKRLSPSFVGEKKISNPPQSRSEVFNKINNSMPDVSLIRLSRENPELVSSAISSVTAGEITIEEATERIQTEGFSVDSGETKVIIMVSPDGEAFEISPEKRQLFLDNGYVEK
jgi:hypothetical protein